jgi:hypothetical protein
MAMHPQEIIKVLTGVAIKHIALAEMERLAEATENEALWSEIIKERARLDDLKAGAEQFRKGVMPQFMRRISDFLAPLALVAPLYVELPLVLVLGLIWLVRRPPGKAVWSWPRALTLYAGIFLVGGGIVAVGFWMISRGTDGGGTVGGVLVLLYSILAPILLHRTARRRVATRSLSATDGLKLHGGALLFLVLLLGLLCPFYLQHYRALPWQMPQADLGMSQEESLYVTRLLAGEVKVSSVTQK